MKRICRNGVRALALGACFAAGPAAAQLPALDLVLDDQKISDAEGGLGEDLAPGDRFGGSVANPGDLDSPPDGIGDLIVGAHYDDDTATEQGAIFVLTLHADGTVESEQKISSAAGDPNDELSLAAFDHFGWSVAFLGDYDGDTRPEVAVGAPHRGFGSVFILDLNPSTFVVESAFEIQSGSTNFTTLSSGDDFGTSLAYLGDWARSGAPNPVPVLAAGAHRDDAGGLGNSGALYLLYLDPNPSASAITGYAVFDADPANPTGLKEPAPGIDAPFDTSGDTWFGHSVTAVGDLDANGQIDLAVGAGRRTSTGAVWLLLLNDELGEPGCDSPATCEVEGFVEIRNGTGGMPPSVLTSNGEFGTAVAWIEGIAGIQAPQLVVGAPLANAPGKIAVGELWVMDVGAAGVSGATKIGADQNWNGALEAGDHFGFSVASLGDRDDDGVFNDLAVGAEFDDDAKSGSDTNAGAVWGLVLSPCTRIITNAVVFHSPDQDGRDLCVPLRVADESRTLHLYIDSGDLETTPGGICVDGMGGGDEICAFDLRLAFSGGLSFDGVSNLMAGAQTNAPSLGAAEVRINWLGTPPGPPVEAVHIADIGVSGDGEAGAVQITAGSAAVDAALGIETIPLDVLALPEPGAVAGLAAGALLLFALRGGRRRARGAVFAAALVALAPVVLRAQPSIETEIRIADGEGGLGVGDIESNWGFGQKLVLIDDIDGDGNRDLAAGAHYRANQSGGQVVIVFLDAQGMAIGRGLVTAPPSPAEPRDFGVSLANLGDFDGLGVSDLLVGDEETSTVGTDKPGSVFVVPLDDEGKARSHFQISSGIGGFPDILSGVDQFGFDATVLGDVDGNGTIEVAVGAPGAEGTSSASGAVYLLSLTPPTGLVDDWVELDDDSSLPFALASGDFFGYSVEAIGDLDGDGYRELAVGARGNDAPGNVTAGAVYILFLDGSLSGDVSVRSDHYMKIEPGAVGVPGLGGFPANPELVDELGWSLGWQPLIDPAAPAGPERDGILYAATGTQSETLWALRLADDGSVAAHYPICETCGVGFSHDLDRFWDFAPIGDINGDEVVDFAVGDSEYASRGAVVVLAMIDADFDQLDDAIDNCPLVSNLDQLDADGDRVGDLCDNCPDAPNGVDLGSCTAGDAALLRASCEIDADCNGQTGGGFCSLDQEDGDGDGEGDACEPVEIRLEFVDTPPNLDDPRWKLSLSCGVYEVTGIAAGMKLPQGAGVDPDCAGSVEGCFTVTGGTVTASSLSGPGLTTPSGVRDDAVYFDIDGAPLCTPLQLPPVEIGILESGTISGTALAASALTEEGVVDEGYLLELAVEATGAVPIEDVRLINGAPAPILDLELGPAVATAGGTKWEVRVIASNEEFFRVAFALIAPAGTTTGDMQWVGCTQDEGGGVRSCCPGGGCSDFEGLGVGTNVNPNRSFTVGPRTPPGSGIGATQLPDTLYVVLEGSAVSNNLSAVNDTLNPAAEGQVHLLGEVFLSSDPDLEPALSVDGANDIEDLFSPGNTLNPLVDVLDVTRSLDEIRLIGAFNPADDIDGDGIQDLGDNCPFVANASQSNRGSFLDGSDDSNALGDACECGEASGDGAVLDPTDFDEIRAHLSGLPTAEAGPDIEARCSVAGTPECNIRDLVFLKQALDATAPSVPTLCDAALSPATP